jgi:hypothetical protein
MNAEVFPGLSTLAVFLIPRGNPQTLSSFARLLEGE